MEAQSCYTRKIIYRAYNLLTCTYNLATHTYNYVSRTATHFLMWQHCASIDI